MNKVCVFVSYAHEDATWFARGSLMPRLVASLETQDNADVWYDKKRLGGGDPWQQEITEAIDRSQIAILLVSTHFLNSEFIREVELPRIEARVGEGRLVAIPVLVGYCDWQSVPFLSRPQMIPGEPTPLVDYRESEARWERVQFEIHQAIRRQIRRISAASAPSAPPEAPRGIDAAGVNDASGDKGGSAVAAVQPPPSSESDAVSTDQAAVSAAPAQGVGGDVSAPPSPAAPPPLEVRAAVEKALRELDFKWDIQRGIVFHDGNSLPVWRQLYGSHKGEAIRELCRLLTDTRPDVNTSIKVIKLLNYGLRVPEGRPLVAQIVDAVSKHVGVGGAVAAMAMPIVDEAPLPKREKWARLLAMLSTVQSDDPYPIVTRLVQAAAPEDRERTSKAVLEALRYAKRGLSVIGALETLDCRSLIPEMREMLFVAPAFMAGDLAILLAKWKDAASAPAIRELILYQGERLSRLPQVLLSLYELEGSPSAECLAETIRLLPPAAKQYLLATWNQEPHCRVAIAAVKEAPLRNLLRELSDESEDANLGRIASDLLSRAS